MQPIVSIVVPVYNACKYLDRCLISIKKQSFTAWECIVIDDGSNDGSDIICDKYSVNDSRFRVYHKKNGGVSSARNLGITHAVGQWILFADADDVLFELLLNNKEYYDEWKNYQKLSNDPRVTKIGKILRKTSLDELPQFIGGYITTDESGNELSNTGGIIKESVSWEKLPLHFYYPFHEKFYGYLWNRLMRLDVLKKHNILFREDIFIKEDGLFGVQFVCASKKNGVYYTKPVYKYTINADGAMKSIENKYDPKYLTDLDACINIYDTIKKSGCKDKKTLFYARMYVCTMLDNITKYLQIHKVDDAFLVKQLRKKTIDSVSYPFYITMRMKSIAKGILK